MCCVGGIEIAIATASVLKQWQGVVSESLRMGGSRGTSWWLENWGR